MASKATPPSLDLPDGMLKDPTVAFTIAVILVPLLFVDGISGALAYLFTPMMVCSWLYLFLVLYVTHSGNCIKLSPKDKVLANWFLMNGVYFNLFLDVVGGQFQMMDEMSRQYLSVNPRYQAGPHSDAGAPVFMTSMLELFFQSPLCLLTYYAIHRGKSYRHIGAFTVSVLHATGVWYFYIPDIIMGFTHLGGWPKSFGEALSFERLLFFWFGFWFCGILWILLPYLIAKDAWNAICKHTGNLPVDKQYKA